ncbi:SDR family NAD(P)-dependent oxidoreductase [Actinokineospora globicatena]|uniref:SDR family NAD(P)-dependent oxidoreductase n=1 Tax=Actinokineospora globicatena TaxID=103729 RepID=UPI0020A4A317|nr:SDR family NAD(P)-dependent oxidoreductase [Actinokineospora globicatena]MCP2303059.1 NAD(P)-dependent dehydrogenase, short-chain alcohol dehydrogenase family [Actinokineospora globicatena]GLW79829.1 short-chain dehydrogenase [Actinokineospora globicatena]GLW85761.1 short-chain dehydrogenase [Actinokineospora globicatena]
MGALRGKVVVVTGAAGGIGGAICRLLAAEGARLVVNDLGCDWDGEGEDPSVAAAVAADLTASGAEVVALSGDTTRPDVAEALVATAVRHWGRLDGVVNAAGTLRDWMFHNIPLEDWQHLLGIHLTGPFLLGQAACRHWRAEAGEGRPVAGRIVNTTSVAGLLGNPGQSCYSAAKAGVAALTRVVAMEMAPYNVTVNAIAPSARTRMTENSTALPDADPTWDLLSPDNTAPLVAYLLTDAAAPITGQIFGVFADVIELYEGWTPTAVAHNGTPWTLPTIHTRLPDLFTHHPRSYTGPLTTPAMTALFGPDNT